MFKREIIEDITVLLRGFFSTPMISSLGRLGVLDKIKSASSFAVDDFPNVANKKLLSDTFRYFVRIGLMENMDNKFNLYRASDLGKEIFRRANSFYVPHSYSEYMYRYHDLVQNPSVAKECEVERLENVIGSGITHQRYFPPAISFLKRKLTFDLIVDIGCGDGQFLSAFLKSLPEKKTIGVDISKLSIEETHKNLKAQYPQKELSTVCCDALDVDKWSKEVLHVAGTDKIVISMWFLLHEISKNRPTDVGEFFRKIHKIFPSAPIIVGEVVRQSDEILAKNNSKSIMSEYLFFHEMSNQGILSWDEYRQVLEDIPYELVFERLFDEAPDSSGNRMPSAFLWTLLPK